MNRNYEWQEFEEIVRPLVQHEAVQSMKKYPHHGITTCYRHCMHVAFYSYLVCKKLGLDEKAAARAGVLHDLFMYDWHEMQPKKGELPHGFTHPHTALANADKYFELSDVEKDMIVKHMFPLTIALPRYKETVVIVCVDKFCGIIETLEAFVIPYLLYKKILRRVAKS